VGKGRVLTHTHASVHLKNEITHNVSVVNFILRVQESQLHKQCVFNKGYSWASVAVLVPGHQDKMSEQMLFILIFNLFFYYK